MSKRFAEKWNVEQKDGRFRIGIGHKRLMLFNIPSGGPTIDLFTLRCVCHAAYTIRCNNNKHSDNVAVCFSSIRQNVIKPKTEFMAIPFDGVGHMVCLWATCRCLFSLLRSCWEIWCQRERLAVYGNDFSAVALLSNVRATRHDVCFDLMFPLGNGRQWWFSIFSKPLYRWFLGSRCLIGRQFSAGFRIVISIRSRNESNRFWFVQKVGDDSNQVLSKIFCGKFARNRKRLWESFDLGGIQFGLCNRSDWNRKFLTSWFFQESDLLQKYRQFEGDSQRFIDWMRNSCRVYSNHAEKCVESLKKLDHSTDWEVPIQLSEVDNSDFEEHSKKGSKVSSQAPERENIPNRSSPRTSGKSRYDSLERKLKELQMQIDQIELITQQHNENLKQWELTLGRNFHEIQSRTINIERIAYESNFAINESNILNRMNETTLNRCNEMMTANCASFSDRIGELEQSMATGLRHCDEKLFDFARTNAETRNGIDTLRCDLPEKFEEIVDKHLAVALQTLKSERDSAKKLEMSFLSAFLLLIFVTFKWA